MKNIKMVSLLFIVSIFIMSSFIGCDYGKKLNIKKPTKSIDITNITTCSGVDKDGKPIDEKSTFSKTDTLYASAIVRNVPYTPNSNTFISVTWLRYDNDTGKKVSVFSSSAEVNEDRYIYSYVAPISEFKTGKYELDFYVNHSLNPVAVKTFNVQ